MDQLKPFCIVLRVLQKARYNDYLIINSSTFEVFIYVISCAMRGG